MKYLNCCNSCSKDNLCQDYIYIYLLLLLLMYRISRAHTLVQYLLFNHRPGTLLFLENLKNILWVTSLFIARRFECIKPLNKSSHGTKAENTMEDMAQLPGDIAGQAICSYQAGVSPCGIVMRVDNITLMQFNTWP